MASDGDESPPTLAGRLRRVGEMLIGLSGSPLPTHLFQTLAEQAQAVVPHDYLAVCLEDAEQRGYLVHSLSGLPGVAGRLFTKAEGLPGRTISTGRAYLVGELDTIPDAAPDLDGVLVRAGLRAALTVPVRRGTQILGALLFARRGAPYTFDDLEVGTLVAAGLSGGLETCRAYQALADERGTLAAVLTSTADAVVMVGQDGIVLLANPATRAMLGVAPEGMTGRPFGEAVPHEPLRRLLAAGRPGIAELSLPDGRTAQASLVIVTTEYGEAVGLAAILRDITLLKDLEQMKTDFVATVSHDLKSPIMAIAMTAELLLKAMPAPGGEQAYRERCERILRSAKNMTELVTDLLDLGKIEAGLEGTGGPVDLVPLIAEAARALAAQAEGKRIGIAVEAPREATVRGMGARLSQVLVNLIGNAVKYTREGGRVLVTLEAPAADGPIKLRVTDNGIGIPARDLPHVFDKFYRVTSDATAGIAGTGLGLAITRSIVEAHEGRIGVESTEGTGSTFWVELPAWVEPPAAPPPRARSA
ncbi:MAG: ATP-binding protein [Candidatus Rokuibacteriota bacterium]